MSIHSATQDAGLPATLDDYKELLKPLEQKMDVLLGASRRVEKFAIMAHSGRRNGEQQPYEVFRFIDADGVSKEPENLRAAPFLILQ
ncbi:hypothetical protein H0H87_010961 [Tephrocybe sp. NHM501043]|nr:hypothetical protein H0H87_010961 [Tephrocybe sp. NHM501043]